MLRIIGFAVFLGVLAYFYFYNLPPKLVVTVKAEVIALEDVEDSNGLRRIQVKMPTGESMWVETYSPFFFRIGYPINIAEYSHILRGTTFYVVAN
ncbi:hypothetical protein [Kordiimonas laminariae]|uniref:hypothetical protein n=1 Tax=Kordiimonas laminariae TaxID=2917717 RepID=UPI001FF50D40|nr:hypothetical protein [Kordiimonas laminariae]MCK0070051.1 hypothetical protein [Kordiimonas laminariae]